MAVSPAKSLVSRVGELLVPFRVARASSNFESGHKKGKAEHMLETQPQGLKKSESRYWFCLRASVKKDKVNGRKKLNAGQSGLGQAPCCLHQPDTILGFLSPGK